MGTLGMRKCGVPSKGGFHYLAAWKRFVGRTFCWAATCQKMPAKAPGKPFPTACAAKAQMLLCRSPFGEGKYLFCKICLHRCAARTNFGGASMAAKNIASLSAQAVERVRQPARLAGRRHWGRICPQGKSLRQTRPTLLAACAAIECAEPGHGRGKTDSRHRFASANCGIPLPPPGRSPRRSSERAPGG